jgi:hypothetical protein
LREGRDGVHGSRVRNPIDGVITDLFIPEGVFRGKECEMSEEADQPRGILIMVLAQNYKLPCIVCTAGFHHGLRYQWVCWLTESLRLPWIVDCESLRDIDPEGESPTKDWQTALDRLVGLIEGKEEI